MVNSVSCCRVFLLLASGVLLCIGCLIQLYEYTLSLGKRRAGVPFYHSHA